VNFNQIVCHLDHFKAFWGLSFSPVRHFDQHRCLFKGGWFTPPPNWCKHDDC